MKESREQDGKQVCANWPNNADNVMMENIQMSIKHKNEQKFWIDRKKEIPELKIKIQENGTHANTAPKIQ